MLLAQWCLLYFLPRRRCAGEEWKSCAALTQILLIFSCAGRLKRGFSMRFWRRRGTRSVQAKRYDIQLVDFSPPRPAGEVSLSCEVHTLFGVYL